MALEVNSLLSAAREQTGFSDLGDDSILEGLEVLVDAINREAKLTDAGVSRWETMIVATLVNRLRVEDWLASHPELLERPVEKPLFVFGLPRTGTTLTINLDRLWPSVRLDWWGMLWIEDHRQTRPVGIALLILFVAATGAGVAAWIRLHRRADDTEPAREAAP